MNNNSDKENNLQKATLGGGCFWCTEAVFKELKGVVEVQTGYSGGHVKNPSYKEVCTGNTGHAEVVQITFDNTVINFSEILEVHFMTHDPTTLNRQGADIGTQYRSAVFYHSEEQKQTATEIIEKLNREKIYDDPAVTEVTPFEVFYKAEDYHRNYFEQNKNQPYCQFVISPKIDKFKKIFKDRLKTRP
ncbi:MAG: peptide-methionine (S)-S-oxide reductase MsrA [Prolixibacteraceae bacterium]|nr:peptide-methionine (S)-S-oxide reductase MsrA [Prolixibacteraceae bacterium]